MLDRIDLLIDVKPVTQDELVGGQAGESTAVVANRVAEAREHQTARFNDGSIKLNSQMDNDKIRQFCALDTATLALARQAIDRLGLSARSYSRILKVARTIADLASEPKILLGHFSEALQYRTH